MPVSHSFFSISISNTSQLAEMMVSGVFSSCPASVMNWRCFSTLWAMGRTARPENRSASRKTARQTTSVTMPEMTRNCRAVVSCVLASRNTTSVPSPVAATR